MRRRKPMMLVLATVMILMIVVSLTACGGGGGDELKGTWEGRSQDMVTTWIFDGKGGCKLKSEYGFEDEGTYEITGNAVSIKMNAWDAPIGYTFKIDGKAMSLIADEDFRPSYELEKIK